MTLRKNRFFLLSSALIITFFLITGFIGYQLNTISIRNEIKDKLKQARVFKERELLNDFNLFNSLLITTTDRVYIQNFLKSSKKNQTELSQWIKANGDSYDWRSKVALERSQSRSTEAGRILSQLPPASSFLHVYFSGSPQPSLPELDHLNYFKQHDLIHPRLYSLFSRFQLGDVILIDSDGFITYSTKKDLYYGANLNSGIFLSSRLAQAYRWSQSAIQGSIRFFDFSPNPLLFTTPTAFFATPVFDKNSFLGTLIFLITLDRIDNRLSNQHDWRSLGLKETGEIVAFGPEGLMRNNSRFYFSNRDSFLNNFPRSSPFWTNIENIKKNRTTALKAGVNSKTLKEKTEDENPDSQILTDYLDQRVLASIGNITIPGGAIWTLMAKMNIDEVNTIVIRRSLPFILFIFTLLVLCLFIVYLLTVQSFRSVDQVNRRLSHILSNNSVATIPPLNGEMDLLSQNLNKLLQKFQNTLQQIDLFKRLLNILPDSILLIKANAQIQSLEIWDINKMACETIGQSESDLKNSDVKDKFEIDYQKLAELKNKNVTESLSLHGYVKQSSGEKIPVDFMWQPILITPEGSFLAVIGQDLRKKKSNEETIENLSDLLYESQSLSKKGTFRWDIQGGEFLCTPQQLKILGLPPDEKLTYDTFRSLILTEDINLFESVITESNQHLSNFTVEYRIRKRNSAEIVWIRTLGHTKYDDYGNALFMYGVTEDITEIRRHEQALISAKNDALKSSQAKSEFLARMSHEIRTPMNAIMGMADLLKETKLSPDQTYYVNIFCKAGEVLMSLINDILDISKIEAGEVSVENIPFDIEDLMKDVSEIMNPRAHEKGIQFSYEIAPSISHKLMGDPTKLRQVLINLVGNSLKFTSTGTIKISVVKNPSKKDSLLISVTDSGVGIPLSKQHMIFQKFSQADSSIARKYGGTGLGLAISKSLIELMGGQIWFKSRENIGTTFFLTIPYREQLYSPTLAKPLNIVEVGYVNNGPKIRPQAKKIKILVVDDTEDNRTLFTHYLKNGPYEIIEAENGLEALDKVKSEKFDIVFMDVQMPEMDGYTATEKIRQWEDEVHRRHIPIIALTAHALSEDRHKSLKAGCDDHIAKPFKKDTLLSVINRFSM